MTSFVTQPTERINQFKSGIDKNESRRKRQELTLNTRRNRRVENLRKKRNIGSAPVDLGGLSLNDLPNLLQAIMGNDPTLYIEAVKGVKKLLSQENSPPIDEVTRHPQVIEKLVSFLSSSSNDLQFETCWALTNIASGTSEHTIAVVQAGAVPQFIKLLSHEKEKIREQTVWALGNISGESPECRDLILDYGGMEQIIPSLESNNATIVQNAAWTVSNLCRGKPKPSWKKVRKVIPSICRVLDTSKSIETLADCLWALSYLSDGDDDRVEAVVNEVNIDRVLSLVKSCDQLLMLPGIRTLGNMVSGTELQTQLCVDRGVIPVISFILKNTTKRSLRKESIWLISNIAASEGMISIVLNDGIVETEVFKLLSNGQDEVRRECLWTIANIVSIGSLSQVDFLVRKGVLKPLVQFLEFRDNKLVKIAMQTLEGILENGEKISLKEDTDNPYLIEVERVGGIDALEVLQDHALDEIYNYALGILEKYFDDDEEIESTNDQWGSFQTQNNSQFNF